MRLFILRTRCQIASQFEGLFIGELNEKEKVAHMCYLLFLAGVQGFEPRKCQSQSLMPYRLAMPHHNTIYYNHFITFCQEFFKKNLENLRLFLTRTYIRGIRSAKLCNVTPCFKAYWQVYPVPPLV